MKKKLLSFILTICFIMPFALVLTACGGKDPEHTHDYETTWSKDSTYHWYACKGEDCDEKKDNATHTYNVDTCSICGYVNSDLTPATLQSMDTYFSGVKAEYLKDSFVGTDSQSTTFEELLDTQIDVLAQDVLFRLYNMYGNTSYSEVLTLKNLNDSNYVYNDSNSYIDKFEIVSNISKSFDCESEVLIEVDLNLPNASECYGKAILINNSNNILNNKSYFMLDGSILGYNTKLTSDLISGKTSFEYDKDKEWAIVSTIGLSTDSITYNDLLQSKNIIKLKIAQAIANDVNETEYNKLLAKINYLGFFDKDKQLICDIIYNHIIGSELVSKDNTYKQWFIDSNSGLINGEALTKIDSDNEFTLTNSPRLYKGYSIVVPAIVEQALANTFEDTDVSLYPKMSRTAYESTTTTTGFATEKEYQTITLMPKADAVTTRLVVKLTGVGSSIGQTIALDYNVVINGTTYSGTKNITLTSTEQEVEINLNAITNGSTLGAYNGTTTSHTSGNAFNNNDFDAQGNLANSDGNNYIKLDFNNTNNYSFIVTFGGMYNK